MNGGSNGRGRGLSNKPAWMSRAEGGAGATSNGDNLSNSRGPAPRDGEDGRNGNIRGPVGGGGMPDYRGGVGRREDFPLQRVDGGGSFRDHQHNPRDRGPPPPSRGGDWRHDRGPQPPGRRGGGGVPSFPPSQRRGGSGPERLRGSALREECFPRFRSYEEERHFVEDRRQKRHGRASLFDKEPSPEEMARMEQMEVLLKSVGGGSGSSFDAPLSTVVPSIVTPSTAAAVMPQQTRHARRLYVGNLPQQIDETEIHTFFRNCIAVATGKKEGFDNTFKSDKKEDDPILSVYINRERLFAFVEFRAMEMTNSCMALDGINLNGKGQIRVKRPNDYNPAFAPNPNLCIPNFDISKLGLVSGTVQDGANKIFIGGLPYHWNDAQVMELVGAFGGLRAFHLVKEAPPSLASKGYCFAEYIEPTNTAIAVAGLNGMDIGDGKSLTARIAARNGAGGAADTSAVEAAVAAATGGGFGEVGMPGGGYAVPPSSLMMSAGATDSASVSNTVDALLNAALGGVDPSSLPAMTSVAPAVADPAALADMAAAYLNQAFPSGAPSLPTPTSNTVEMTPGVLMTTASAAHAEHVATAALDAAFSNLPMEPAPSSARTSSAAQQPTMSATNPPSPILVLMNMVMEDDLASDQNYADLKEEVKEECEKYGKILSIKIPRVQDGVSTSAIQKIFLQYASVQDAVGANQQLSGRQFGPNTVQTSYFDEASYHQGDLE